MNTPELDQDAVHYRDRKGNPLTLMQWTQLYQDRDYRLVTDTKHGDLLVRTLWEGIDDGVEVACQYHTGIHWAGEWITVWEGYWPCTDKQAKARHNAIVALVRETFPDRTAEHKAQLQLRTRAIQREIGTWLDKAADELADEDRTPEESLQHFKAFAVRHGPTPDNEK